MLHKRFIRSDSYSCGRVVITSVAAMYLSSRAGGLGMEGEEASSDVIAGGSGGKWIGCCVSRIRFIAKKGSVEDHV